ncbi:MAG: hypothetical protein DRO67_08240 [Candidatus Asgardarchaeum californiense]|nr:MAG: hypothetical protein DRO67_08240 [Candidatus Asgardarchaeum californiense]
MIDLLFVRFMEPDDFSIISSLLEDYIQEVTDIDIDDDMTSDELLQAILADNNQILIASLADEIVGFSIIRLIEKKIGLIQGIFVEQEHRGRGIGVRLLELSEEVLGSQGANVIMAEAVSSEGYYFMVKHGYKRIKDRTLAKGKKPPACA